MLVPETFRHTDTADNSDTTLVVTGIGAIVSGASFLSVSYPYKARQFQVPVVSDDGNFTRW